MARIPERALSTLKEIAALMGENRQEILVKALEAYRRQQFLERANAAFAALKGDRQEWESEREERRARDVTLADGLDD